MMTDYWLVAFDSTHHALSAEAALDGAGLENDIRPTPKAITAGCALAIDFLAKDYDAVKKVIGDRSIVIRGYFRPDDDGYVRLS